VSQLLTRRKRRPPRAHRDLRPHGSLPEFPTGELARVAEAQLKEDRKRRLGDIAPLFSGIARPAGPHMRPGTGGQARAIFERQSFRRAWNGWSRRRCSRSPASAPTSCTSRRSSAPGSRRAVASWGWDPVSFAITVTGASGERKRFAYVERNDANVDREKGCRNSCASRCSVARRRRRSYRFSGALQLKAGGLRLSTIIASSRIWRDPLHFSCVS